jgi:hypothetical protein
LSDEVQFFPSSSICFLPDLTIWGNCEVRHMHHQTLKCLSESNGISFDVGLLVTSVSLAALFIG